MTFNETMGLLADRFGRRVEVSVSGKHERGPAVAMTLTGTLKQGFDQKQLGAAHANGVDDIVAFGFEEFDGVTIYLDPAEFRDAFVHGDKLRIDVGYDLRLEIGPPLLA